ncbi:MAG: hypothetical protein JWO43_137 [Candidatus Adlerbacteria bacterium]|nr:hypothetical protein [Candidatus Adlerbacteria bacterium]
MSFFSQNKFLSIGVAAVICAILYFMFNSSSAPSQPLTTSTANPALTQQLLAALASLHTIQLDDTVFTNPVFVSLTDFGVTIPPENVGRRNPFQPLSGGVVSSGGTSGVNLQGLSR